MDRRTEVELFEQKGSFSQICRYGFRRTSPWFRRAALRLKDLQLSPPRAKESSSADLWECVTLRNRMVEEGKGADKGRSMAETLERSIALSRAQTSLQQAFKSKQFSFAGRGPNS